MSADDDASGDSGTYYNWIRIGYSIVNNAGHIYVNSYADWSKQPFYMQTDVFGVTWDSNTSFIPNTDRLYYSWKVQKSGYPNGYPVNGTYNRIPASGTGGLAYTFSLSECYKNGVVPLYDDGDFSVRLSFEANPANAISGYCNYTFTYAHQQSKISTSSPSIDLKSGGLSITPTVTTYWDYAFIDGRIKR